MPKHSLTFKVLCDYRGPENLELCRTVTLNTQWRTFSTCYYSDITGPISTMWHNTRHRTDNWSIAVFLALLSFSKAKMKIFYYFYNIRILLVSAGNSFASEKGIIFLSKILCQTLWFITDLVILGYRNFVLCLFIHWYFTWRRPFLQIFLTIIIKYEVSFNFWVAGVSYEHFGILKIDVLCELVCWAVTVIKFLN